MMLQRSLLLVLVLLALLSGCTENDDEPPPSETTTGGDASGDTPDEKPDGGKDATSEPHDSGPPSDGEASSDEVRLTLPPAPVAANARKDAQGVRDVVASAKALLEDKGAAALQTFAKPLEPWTKGGSHVIVWSPSGEILTDSLAPTLVGAEGSALVDAAGRPLGALILATADHPDRSGWVHFEQVPAGDPFPRWKSLYLTKVELPSGTSYLVGCDDFDVPPDEGMVEDLVESARTHVQKVGEYGYAEFLDPLAGYQYNDQYLFIMDFTAILILEAGFPYLTTGRDAQSYAESEGPDGVPWFSEAVAAVQAHQDGVWYDHLWPSPGDTNFREKHTYLKALQLEGKAVVIGSGLYRGEVSADPVATTTAQDLEHFVAEAVTLLEAKGQAAFSDLRDPEGTWYKEDRYVFVWDLNGKRLVYPPDPSIEGTSALETTDVDGRPFGQWLLEAAARGGGWVHYRIPAPGELFASWKSTYAREATLKGGQRVLVASGEFDLRPDEHLVEDLVEQATALLREHLLVGLERLNQPHAGYNLDEVRVLVFDASGDVLVEPAIPGLARETNLSEIKGNEDLLARAKPDELTWLTVNWARTSGEAPRSGRAAVTRIEMEGRNLVLLAGFLD